MADDHGDGVTAKGEDRVADQDRDADAEIFPKKGLCFHEEVVDLKSDLLIDDEEIEEVGECLEPTGEKGCERGAGDTHLRSTEVAEDQHVVTGEIDNERADRDIQWEAGLADASEHDGDDQRKTKEEESQRGPAQVCRAKSDELFFIRVGGHDQLRHCNRTDGEDRGEEEHQAQHQADRLLQRDVRFLDIVVCFFHAVVTGDQDGSAHAETHAEDLEDHDVGIGQRGGREGILRVVAEHDVVEHADKYRDQRLQRDRES